MIQARHFNHDNWMNTISVACWLVSLLFSVATLKAADPPRDIFQLAWSGDISKVQALLDAGASLEASDPDTQHYSLTLLSIAALRGDTAAVEKLLQRGAHIEHASKVGVTPLMQAAIHGQEAVARLLLKEGAALNAQNQYEESPLCLAVINEYPHMVQTLIELGADIDLPAQYGTPLLYAAGRRNKPILEMLIKAGAHINAANKFGQTPLMNACDYECLKIAQCLITHGANPNVQDTQGRTALMRVLDGNFQYRSAMVKMLVEAGTNLQMTDKRGRTALGIAQQRGWAWAVTYLQQKDVHPSEITLLDSLSNGHPPLYQRWAMAATAPFLAAEDGVQGAPGGIDPANMKLARQQLRTHWGIHSFEEFNRVMEYYRSVGTHARFENLPPNFQSFSDVAFHDYLSRYNNDPISCAKTMYIYKNLCRSHKSSQTMAVSGLAWDMACLLHLVDLGVQAEWLHTAEADATRRMAIIQLKTHMNSWDSFRENFMIGIQLDCPLDATRFSYILGQLTKNPHSRNPWQHIRFGNSWDAVAWDILGNNDDGVKDSNISKFFTVLSWIGHIF